VITDAAPALGAVGRARASVAALRVLAQLRREGRTTATADERDTLSSWSGWGPLAPMFAASTPTWGEIGEHIGELLPRADVELGMQGTYNAFFTPQPVVDAMWTLLQGLGYTGGPVLEPGCGSGRFMLGAPPAAAMTGVERDTTSAAICALLNPDATVLHGELQNTRLGSRYAAVIGNVPFGDVPVFDPGAPSEVTTNLHNYFIWRAVAALAPGGIAVLLTSRYTMDSHDKRARVEIRELADFVGAIRLPNGALSAGGTDIAADIVVLRRHDGRDTRPFQWITVDTERFGWSVPVNEWWQESPLAVLGTMHAGKTSQYGLGLAVDPHPDRALESDLSAAVGALVVSAHCRDMSWADNSAAARSAVDELSASGLYEGAFFRRDGKLLNVRKGVAEEVRETAELTALLHLQDLAAKLVEAEVDHDRPDADIEPLRRRTARAYQAYVGKYGPLNRSVLVEGPADEETGLPTFRRNTPSMGGFRRSPGAALTFALEVYDDETGQARPAPILSERQNRRVTRPTTTTDPAEALAWCLDRNGGRVDLGFIAETLGTSRLAVPGMLGDAVFQDPADRSWVTAEEYLSGDVRAKLSTAELAAETDETLRRNVDALRAVQPTWLGPGDITANLGTPWIGVTDVSRFIRETLGAGATVNRLAATGQWELQIDSDHRESVKARDEWGTPDVDAYRLIELALNGRVPTVSREVRVGDSVVSRKDPDASMLAAQKQQALKERFSAWVWENPERCDRLVTYYNLTYNSLVPRRFDGEHVVVEGLAPWFTPYPHQREFVARAMATPAALCGHPVGAGKTATMAMTVMKLRQAGLVRLPMLVVPNHLIEQVDREVRQLFPAARVLSASSASISANRRSFTARCATGDWDVVIITHSAFDRLPVDPDTEESYLDVQREALRLSIAASCPDGRLKGRMVKAAAKRLDALAARIKELRHRKLGYDAGVTFEQMGVDWIGIDEAHYYKNLSVPCRTEGFSVRPSKRATDLDVKLSWLAQRGHGRYAALFTGTPVSNTMLELYVVLHYTMPDRLERMGLGSADAWAAAFAQFVTSVDVTVDGGQFELRTRPALFVNAPELRVLLSQAADIRTAEQLGLKRPAMVLHEVVVEPTLAQQLYSMDLVRRAELVKGRRDVVEGADNMLAICGDGRRMATDPALVGLIDPEQGKLHEVAATITRVWREHPQELQIAFLDVGTPNAKRGSQTYGKLRALLTDAGMDGRRIRFIHDAKNDAAKAALFADCRAGRVSVVIGSTDKLGVGTNIQDRVVAMHHVDAPFRPADVEQRDGRGLRPGNRHAEVHVFRYVTRRTFDAFMWQMLLRKITFIGQVTSGNLDRTVEDVAGEVVASYASLKAAAADQPLLLEQAALRAEVKRLRSLERNHSATLSKLDRDIPRLRKAVEAAEAEAPLWDALREHAGDNPDVTEDEAAALHKVMTVFMAGYGYRSAPVTVAGVSLMFGQWRDTMGERTERQPEFVVTLAGGGELTSRAFKHWTPATLRHRLNAFLGEGAWRGNRLRVAAAENRDEIASATALQDKPFDGADQLRRGVIRLDQIDAELRDAAAVNAAGDRPVLDLAQLERFRAPRDDGPALDAGTDDDWETLLGSWVDDLERSVAAGLEELFGDILTP
jgi:N12 class adenine-specific DNA methylase